MAVPRVGGSLMCIPHAEATTMRNRTNNSIGDRRIKILRDAAVRGYTAGMNMIYPHAVPPSVTMDKVHCMAYDIKAQFHGDALSSIGDPMICASLACSCGRLCVVSRGRVYNTRYDTHIVKTNEKMDNMITNIMIYHNPLFTVQHNVHMFDNVLKGKKHSQA